MLPAAEHCAPLPMPQPVMTNTTSSSPAPVATTRARRPSPAFTAMSGFDSRAAHALAVTAAPMAVRKPERSVATESIRSPLRDP